MKKSTILILIACCCLLFVEKITAQPSHFTDTYQELLKQRSLYPYPTSSWDSLRCAWYGDCTTLPSSVNKVRTACSLNKRMFGWHVIGTSSANYVWSSISDLSYFSYDVDPATGNAINSTQIANWATDATIVAAKANGVNVNLCVTLFNNTNEFSTFFGSSSAQTTLRNNLVNAVVAANAKGINIDFEGSGLASTYNTAFIAFMSALSTQLHNAVPGSELSIDLAAGYSGSSTMLSQLNSSVDLFLIMAYDYYWNSQGSPGPVAPLYNFYSSGNGNASNDLNNFLKVISANKIILGMPYYGRRWGVTNACTLPGTGSGTSAISTQTYSQYRQNSNGYYSNPKRDAYTFNAYNCFNDANSIANQQFMDDAYSFQKKYNVIRQRGIAGGAVWHLGYDGTYTDLWDLVSDNLSACPVSPCSDTIYDMGGPLGNYHNSEDYTFTISPTNANAVTLTFSSFDLESGFDSLKIYNGTSTASPLIAKLSGSTVPSPVTATSGSMTIQFHSDGATTKAGYEAVYACSIYPDLIVNNQSLSSISMLAGANVTAYCAEANAGNGNAGANMVMLYLSPNAVLTPGLNGDVLLDSISFPSLAANTNGSVLNKTIQIPNGTTPGNYYLFYWADGKQVITETNEGNNFATVSFTVIPPSYTISTSSNPVNGGTTIGNGVFVSGKMDTVIANNNPGYLFVNWTENGTVVSTNPSYSFTVTGDRSLVANFSVCNASIAATGIMSPTDTICLGDSVSLTEVGGSLGTGATWRWRSSVCNTGTIIGTTTSLKVAPIVNTSYCIKPEGGACAAPIACSCKTISIRQKPVASNITANSAAQFCIGDSVILSGNIGGIWNTGDVSSNLIVKTPGTYFAVKTNTCGTDTSNKIMVTVHQLPVVDAGNSDSMVQGSSVKIGGNPTASGTAPFTYNWTPLTALDSPLIANSFASPSSSTTYTVHVKDGNGCSNSDSMRVTVLPLICSYVLSDTAQAFGDAGGTHSITITTSAPSCLWSAVNANTWFQVKPDTIKAGAGSITVSVDSCNGAVSRSGTFIVAGITYIVSQTCTVIQCTNPVANFAASQTAGQCPFTVDFFDLSTTKENPSRLWTFYNGTGNPISSGLKNPSILYSLAGNYLVKLEVTDSCGTDSKTVSGYIVVTCPSTLDNVSTQSGFSVYPNPVNDFIQIESAEIKNGDYILQLQNNLGQIVFDVHERMENNQMKKQLSIAELSEGVYILSIAHESAKTLFRIQKINKRGF